MYGMPTKTFETINVITVKRLFIISNDWIAISIVNTQSQNFGPVLSATRNMTGKIRYDSIMSANLGLTPNTSL